MDAYNANGHSVYDIKYHIIWVTKYRYHVLKGEVAERTRELLRQGCQARGTTSMGKRIFLCDSRQCNRRNSE